MCNVLAPGFNVAHQERLGLLRACLAVATRAASYPRVVERWFPRAHQGGLEFAHQEHPLSLERCPLGHVTPKHLSSSLQQQVHVGVLCPVTVPCVVLRGVLLIGLVVKRAVNRKYEGQPLPLERRIFCKAALFQHLMPPPPQRFLVLFPPARPDGLPRVGSFVGVHRGLRRRLGQSADSGVVLLPPRRGTPYRACRQSGRRRDATVVPGCQHVATTPLGDRWARCAVGRSV
mmetsp:Transcript_27358/g.71724  ORF Transcript_27358/g.71724 Transcript_27358/m.71724 type:complete len:231 (-) Transcript_27358:425-1117(-)